MSVKGYIRSIRFPPLSYPAFPFSHPWKTIHGSPSGESRVGGVVNTSHDPGPTVSL
jgi:hypothetical protein